MIFYKSRSLETAGIGAKLVCVHLCVCVHSCTHQLLSHSVIFLSASLKYEWIRIFTSWPNRNLIRSNVYVWRWVGNMFSTQTFDFRDLNLYYLVVTDLVLEILSRSLFHWSCIDLIKLYCLCSRSFHLLFIYIWTQFFLHEFI